jgi:hypothetical protein
MIVKISLFLSQKEIYMYFPTRFICEQDLFANKIYYANMCEFNEKKCVSRGSI